MRGGNRCIREILYFAAISTNSSHGAGSERYLRAEGNIGECHKAWSHDVVSRDVEEPSVGRYLDILKNALKIVSLSPETRLVPWSESGVGGS